MSSQIIFSQNIIGALESLVSKNKPAIETENGKVYIEKSLPVGAIRLNIPLHDYLRYIQSLPDKIKPRAFHLIPEQNDSFDIIINAQAVVENGKITIESREVKII